MEQVCLKSLNVTQPAEVLTCLVVSCVAFRTFGGTISESTLFDQAAVDLQSPKAHQFPDLYLHRSGRRTCRRNRSRVRLWSDYSLTLNLLRRHVRLPIRCRCSGSRNWWALGVFWSMAAEGSSKRHAAYERDYQSAWLNSHLTYAWQYIKKKRVPRFDRLEQLKQLEPCGCSRRKIYMVKLLTGDRPPAPPNNCRATRGRPG